MKKILFVFLNMIIAVALFASTGNNEEYTCPLCGTEFESWTQMSYTTFGQNLDLRKFGAAAIPTPIPKCPECNLVFFEKSFDKEDIEILKAELKTNNIFAKEPNMPKYYYYARESEIVGHDLEDIIWRFLSSVWENRESDKKNGLINTTIEYIDKLENTSEMYDTYQLVKLDLLRRSGQFNEATKLIAKIKTNKDFYKDYIVEVIDLQTELIKKKDQKEHQLPK